MNLTVYLQDDDGSWTDITRWVTLEDFDEWVKTKVKGSGFFEWEMEPVKVPVFKLDYDAPILELNRRVRILRNNQLILEGFIDEIEDEFEDRPILIVEPVGILAKDAMAGSEQDDGGYVLDTRQGGQGMTLNQVIGLLIYSLNQNLPDDVPDVSFYSTVTTGENLVSAFYGEVLSEWFDGDRYPFAEDIYGVSELYSIRERDNNYYAFRGVLGDGGQGEVIYYRVRQLNELDYENEFLLEPHEVIPYTIVTNNDPGLEQVYIDDWTADNGLQFVSQNGCIQIGDSYWTLILSSYQFHFVRFRDVFANHRIVAVLRDMTVAAVLKLWAMLTNHWIGFDGAHLLFLARSDAREDLSIPAGQIAEKEQTRIRYENIDIDIPKLKLAGSEVEDYGVGYSEKHISAIKRYYRLLWEGDYIETKLTVGDFPDEVDLSLLGQDAAYGHVIALEYASTERMLKVVLVEES